jgi:Leucine-rich repeat (LRR) protein
VEEEDSNDFFKSFKNHIKRDFLDLSNKNIKELSDNFWCQYPNLKRLDIAHNELTFISSDFENLEL